MDGHAGNFEDQFRRMVVSNGVAPTQRNHTGPSQPTVRLPPASSYPVTQQQLPSTGFPPRPQYGYLNSAPPHYTSGSGPPYGNAANRQFAGPRSTHHFSQPQSSYQQRGSLHGPPTQRVHDGQFAGQRSRNQQQVPLDPNAFQRTGHVPLRGRGGQQGLFNPHQPRGPTMSFGSFADQRQRQTNYLQGIASSEVTSVQMSQSERDGKNAFRQALQQVCNDVCDADPERLLRVSLECFGSFKSGFATAGSDMDLVIVVKDQTSTSASLSLLEDDLPRALERMLLKLGFGARLLTRTRVPIIKVCEKPGDSLLSKLRAEREKWDLLPHEQKYPHLHLDDDDPAADAIGEPVDDALMDKASSTKSAPIDNSGAILSPVNPAPTPQANGHNRTVSGASTSAAPREQSKPSIPSEPIEATPKPEATRAKREDRQWIRERKAGPLDFPKDGVGIQSDINFFNPLGLHNTQMLYCYSLCDDRVQPMILFVKAWAKRRKINSSYSGTLSSYGYVLMVLHYLVNVASPAVLPNLQSPSPPGKTSPAEPGVEVDGWHVNFWRDDQEILAAKHRGSLTLNREPLGSLLAGFFNYYSSQGQGPQFIWTQQVLSLRTQGGILSKEEKGWTKAVTQEGEGKKIQHRFLFSIEDPFELAHNVARTVTHNGIVAIRDEFRRAKRILTIVGRGEVAYHDGQLFEELIEPELVPSMAAESVKAEGWQPDLDGVTDKDKPGVVPVYPKPAQNNRPSSGQASRKQTPVKTPAQANSLNVTDNDAFPTLGAASSTKPKKRSPAHKRVPSQGEYSEITGEKAKAVLEEVRRKKDEAQAECTALGAAEAVLGDD